MSSLRIQEEEIESSLHYSCITNSYFLIDVTKYSTRSNIRKKCLFCLVVWDVLVLSVFKGIGFKEGGGQQSPATVPWISKSSLQSHRALSWSQSVIKTEVGSNLYPSKTPLGEQLPISSGSLHYPDQKGSRVSLRSKILSTQFSLLAPRMCGRSEPQPDSSSCLFLFLCSLLHGPAFPKSLTYLVFSCGMLLGAL